MLSKSSLIRVDYYSNAVRVEGMLKIETSSPQIRTVKQRWHITVWRTLALLLTLLLENDAIWEDSIAAYSFRWNKKFLISAIVTRYYWQLLLNRNRSSVGREWATHYFARWRAPETKTTSSVDSFPLTFNACRLDVSQRKNLIRLFTLSAMAETVFGSLGGWKKRDVLSRRFTFGLLKRSVNNVSRYRQQLTSSNHLRDRYFL